MDTTIPLTTDEVMERGRRIYEEQIRHQLTEEDRGKFVEINVLTGDWVMDINDSVAARLARERFGQGVRRYVHKVGYRTPYTLGFPQSANREAIE